MSAPTPAAQEVAPLDPFAPPRAPAEPPATTSGVVAVLPPRQGVIGWLQASAALAALTALGQVHLILVINQANPSMSSLQRADLVTMVLGLASFVVLVATIVAWGRWVHRAAKNIRALVPDGVFEFTPASQIWWYFVPIANLFKPPRGTREIWSYTMVGTDRVGTDPTVIHTWWGFWIASNILSSIAVRASPDPGSAVDSTSFFDALTLSGGLSIGAEILSIAAVFFALRVIRAINEAQGSALP